MGRREFVQSRKIRRIVARVLRILAKFLWIVVGVLGIILLRAFISVVFFILLLCGVLLVYFWDYKSISSHDKSFTKNSDAYERIVDYVQDYRDDKKEHGQTTNLKLIPTNVTKDLSTELNWEITSSKPLVI